MWSGRSGWRGDGQGKPAARSCRPLLEQLENRLAPAVFHVNTFQDTVAVNTATGQDAAGHVSLRSAVMAANVSPTRDTIVLAAGVYAVPSGDLPIHGNLQIIGQGAGQTVVEARHLERLFEVDGGNLQLTGLTLNGGSASALLTGDVHLTDCFITDTDVAAVVDALLAHKSSAPPPQPAALIPSANQQVAPELVRASAAPSQLVGQAGGGSTEQDQSQDATHEQHQTFWRVDSDATGDQPAPDMPEEMKQSSPDYKDASAAPSLDQSEDKATPAHEPGTGAQPEPKYETLAGAFEQAETRNAIDKSAPGQAVVLALTLSCNFLPRSVQKCRSTRGRHNLLRDWNQDAWRRKNPPRESRHTRGPPALVPLSKNRDQWQQGRPTSALFMFP